MNKIKVKYTGVDNPIALRTGKIYDAYPCKNGWFGVIDESGEEYAYMPTHFEVVECTPVVVSFTLLWSDIGNVLIGGTLEQTRSVRCPKCGGGLRSTYVRELGYVITVCRNCGDSSQDTALGEPPIFVRHATV
jgi:predicted RNA-binding Zn-ribbon protein involved in translation (DUF1610 family)